MKDVILKAVANPPKLFWGPVLPTALNAGLQIPFMFMAIELNGYTHKWVIQQPLLLSIST